MTALLLALALAAQPAETGAGGALPSTAAAALAPPVEPTLAPPQGAPLGSPAAVGPAPSAAAPSPTERASPPSTGLLPAPAANPMPSLVTALPALSALAALAALALWLSRRRGTPGRRLVAVVETAHLAPKRQLVVVRMDDQLLLLGSSETGITLLSSRPAAEAEKPAEDREPAGSGLPEGGPLAGVTQLWERLRGVVPKPPPAAAFESLLEESSEDLELRRKLARGLQGRVA